MIAVLCNRVMSAELSPPIEEKRGSHLQIKSWCWNTTMSTVS